MLKFDEVTTKLLEIAYQGGDVRRRRRMAFDALCLSEGDTVVDIGCGNGLLTKEITRALGRPVVLSGSTPVKTCAFQPRTDAPHFPRFRSQMVWPMSCR